MSKRALDRLAQLLEVERTALLAGDLEALGALTAQKEILVTEFEGADAYDLSTLSSALERNGTLLAAAIDGVSTVLTMLRQQRDARMSLSSYDSNGNATKIAQPTRGTERRF